MYFQVPTRDWSTMDSGKYISAVYYTWKMKIIYNFRNTTANIQAVYPDFLS